MTKLLRSFKAKAVRNSNLLLNENSPRDRKAYEAEKARYDCYRVSPIHR